MQSPDRCRCAGEGPKRSTHALGVHGQMLVWRRVETVNILPLPAAGLSVARYFSAGESASIVGRRNLGGKRTRNGVGDRWSRRLRNKEVPWPRSLVPALLLFPLRFA